MTGAAEVVLGMKRAADCALSGTAVATVGKISAFPGAANIIPGEVEFFVDIRDIDEESIDNLAKELFSLVNYSAERYGLTHDIQRLAKSPAVGLDPDVADLVHKNATELGFSAKRMNSGAVHDSVMMTDVTKVGMIFVPSIGGLSHCPEEFTRDEDIEAGAKVLFETVRQLAEET